MLLDIDSRKLTTLTSDWDRSVSQFSWTPDNKGFYATVEDAATNRIYSIDAKNGKVKAITEATDFSQPAIGKDGELIATNQSFLYPARLVSINPRNGKIERLENFNDDILKDVDLGTYESVTYKGYQGKDIQMWVHYPAGFDRSKNTHCLCSSTAGHTMPLPTVSISVGTRKPLLLGVMSLRGQTSTVRVALVRNLPIPSIPIGRQNPLRMCSRRQTGLNNKAG